MERKKKPQRRPPSSAAPPPWIELPRELTANILLRLGVLGMLDTAQLVCTTWRSVTMDPAMWRIVDLKLGNFIEVEELDEVATYIYEAYFLAVKRSQGELQEINIEYFGADELLCRIAARSNKLRRLRIAHCSYITSGEVLCKAVKSFPELEELHLSYMTSICPKEIEAIGSSCPKLKTFTFSEQGLTHPVKNDKLAFAVAKSMPNLCHLRLFANGMTNKGLQAVLDGCPKLEYLDIRQCFNLVLEGEPGERCLKVKNVRRPSDSILDYEVVAAVIDNEPFDLAYLEEGHSGNDDGESDESDLDNQ